MHGVLNSDNMSVLGLTLDFGPFAFIERFDPRFTPNLSDRDARYCYVNQPAACAWNLARLGDALVRAGALDEARARRRRRRRSTRRFARGTSSA